MESWTARDMPDQTGRTALVTGANSGLGLQTSLELARRGARVLIAQSDVAAARLWDISNDLVGVRFPF